MIHKLCDQLDSQLPFASISITSDTAMAPNSASTGDIVNDRWHTFTEVLHRLHAEGIYIHSDQLAEFFLKHQLPVSLHHVPDHLKPLAERINTAYRGDMARLEDSY